MVKARLSSRAQVHPTSHSPLTPLSLKEKEAENENWNKLHPEDINNFRVKEPSRITSVCPTSP